MFVLYYKKRAVLNVYYFERSPLIGFYVLIYEINMTKSHKPFWPEYEIIFPGKYK